MLTGFFCEIIKDIENQILKAPPLSAIFLQVHFVLYYNSF